MNTKKLVALFLFALLTAVAASAQKTTVTATIVDPNGIPYANGSVTAQLVPAGVSNPTVGGAAIGGNVGPAATDDNGRFSMDLFCNTTGGACTTAISPANTKWQFTVCNPGVPSPLGFGNQCFTPAAITITGTTQDVSTQMNAVAPVLTRLVGVRIFSGPPTGTCSAGQLAVDSTTGTLYSCNGGVWQLVGGVTNTGAGPPGGSCQPNQLYVDTTTGVLYTCNGGTWTPAAGGGSGTVTGFSYTGTGLTPIMSSVVTNPSTTPNLAQTAPSVAPGMVLAGPIPVTTGGNPFFSNAAIAAGSSTTPSVTATPSASSGVEIWFVTAPSVGATPPNPGGFTLLDSSSTSSIYYKTFATGAQQTVSTTISPTSNWTASLSFFGGSISSVPHSVSIPQGNGPACTSATLSSVSAGNSILVVDNIGTGLGSGFGPYTVSDSLGNSYTQVAFATSGTNTAQVIFIASNVVAGSPVITFCNNGFGSTVVLKAYELAGMTSYYSGANGPYNFRYLTPQDLAALTGGLGFTKIQRLRVSGATICTPPSANTYDACSFNAPWPSAFADTNYTAVCFAADNAANGGNSTTNDSVNVYADQTGQTASQIKIIVQNNRSIANKPAQIDCIAVHP